jgi:hypothetical protein
MRRRISRLTAESLPWWVQLLGTLLGASAPATRHAADRFCSLDNQAMLNECGLAEISFLAQVGRPPRAEDRVRSRR